MKISKHELDSLSGYLDIAKRMAKDGKIDDCQTFAIEALKLIQDIKRQNGLLKEIVQIHDIVDIGDFLGIDSVVEGD